MSLTPINDINQFLKKEYKAYVNKVFYAALSEPAKFAAFKEKVRVDLEGNLSKYIYMIVYRVLDSGKKVVINNAGNPVESPDTFFDGDAPTILINSQPKYQQEDIQEIATGAAKAINTVFDEVMEILFPDFVTKVLSEKLGKIGNQQLT